MQNQPPDRKQDAHAHHGHDHHEDHDHGPAHAGHAHAGHSHGSPADLGRIFLVGIALNLAFVVAEWVFGVMSQSLALMADATHNLGDVLGLGLAWGAYQLSRRAPSERFTYGLRGSSILAALANALILVLVTGGLAWEAIQRLADPQPVDGVIVIAVALAGVVVNGVTAWLFMSRQKSDLNVRGAYLHMAADAAVSLGVALAGLVVMATGWLWLDPAVTLVLGAVIVAGTWGLLRASFKLALQAVPEAIDTAAVRDYLGQLPGVAGVHDLHIWGMSTTENAMTAHLVCPSGHPGDDFLQRIAADIDRKFSIHHVTLQVELGDTGRTCVLAPPEVV
ncbi:cation diffusion facilitator family transporter [Caenimonas terrae]|uniref:Cation diffusion facilitator family transporter n=1 Tax=Caenimonas terrae TaxID=696074 RepID=A0ABW0N8X4_9BURK